jgi:hypothetical protein
MLPATCIVLCVILLDRFPAVQSSYYDDGPCFYDGKLLKIEGVGVSGNLKDIILYIDVYTFRS